MTINRRNFIKKTTAAIAGSTMIPSAVAYGRQGRYFQPSDRVHVALVGVHSMGWGDLSVFLRQPGVVCKALADVDARELARRTKDLEEMGSPKPDLYGDYRKMLEDPDIDVVIIGTPDHWHCLPFIDSLQAGKHIYVEKPLANSLAEVDVMLDAAGKYDKVVQVGQQQRSGTHWKSAIDLVKSGKMGMIRQVKFWANFNYGAGNMPVPDSEAPAGVDYDTWLGPAPERPFNKNRFHGSWRMFRDYGGGLMTDWGVHLIDMGLWAMDVDRPPLAVQASGGTYAEFDRALEWPDTLHVHYDMGDFLMTWEHNGGIETGPWNRKYGVAFIGENGTLVADRTNWELFPEKEGDHFKMEKIPPVESDGESRRNHVKNFMDVLRNGGDLNCGIETGHRAAQYAHLGNIAFLTGDKLVYDEKRRKFLNSEKANEIYKPDYRSPWQFPVI